VNFLSRTGLFNKLECKNCLFKGSLTAGTNALTTFGETLETVILLPFFTASTNKSEQLTA